MSRETVKIKYFKGRTLNMGNYESTKFEVGVEVICGSTPDGVEKAWAWAEKFVEDKIDEKEKEVLL